MAKFLKQYTHAEESKEQGGTLLLPRQLDQQSLNIRLMWYDFIFLTFLNASQVFKILIGEGPVEIILSQTQALYTQAQETWQSVLHGREDFDFQIMEFWSKTGELPT